MTEKEAVEMARNAGLEFMRAVKCGSGPGEMDSLSKSLGMPSQALLLLVQSAIDCCEEEPPAEAN